MGAARLAPRLADDDLRNQESEHIQHATGIVVVPRFAASVARLAER